jgi:hypothetical protein
MLGHPHLVRDPTIDDDSEGVFTEPHIDASNAKALFKEALATVMAESREEIQASALLRDSAFPLLVTQSDTNILGGHLGSNPDDIFPSSTPKSTARSTIYYGVGKANFPSDEGKCLDANEAMHRASPPTGQTIRMFEDFADATQWVADQQLGRRHGSLGEGGTVQTSRVTETLAEMPSGGGD